MADFTSIARPYALAAFEYARDGNELPNWKSFLEAASLVAQNPAIQRLLNDPEIGTQQTFDLFNDVLASELNAARKNFLLLLAQNKRLPALASISELFNAYYAQLQKISEIRVITAIDIEESYRQKLMQALTKRIHHEVNLECQVDPSILGGAIIQVGDKVIDGSIRGKLNRMLNNLTS